MKETYVSDLRPNQIVVSDFLVQAKEVRSKKTGGNYLSLALADKTGEVEAKVWDNVELMEPTFARDDFVKVKGAVQVYQNRHQITIHKLKRLEDREVDLADFFPRSARDPEEMWQEIEGVVASIGNEHLRTLIGRILSDPEIASRLKLAPAAKSLHHAYLGGLLEHVLSLCRLARLVLQNYPDLDPDLVIAGALLHDLGKVHELSYSRSFAYTTEGQLLGHMIIELEILHKALAEQPEFPRPLQTLLEHIIISHHGQYEFGSPKLPMFREALLFHYLDDLDSKLQNMDTLLKRDQALGGEWTRYSPSLGRTILDTQKFLERSETPAEESESSSETPKNFILGDLSTYTKGTPDDDPSG